MAARMQNADPAFADDMFLVRDMIHGHERIKRTVTNLPNGIRTVTESDDPQMAQTIKTHVASMAQRLNDGRVFNLFSPTLPILFENKDKIKTQVETTNTGVVVTQTSGDAAVVAALQAHAVEVSELARDEQAAMMRNARAAMGMMARGPRFGTGPGSTPPAGAPAAEPSR
jgi:PHD/YefM family antitoxin component YafN of YafNO toxin-antitoxin module